MFVHKRDQQVLQIKAFKSILDLETAIWSQGPFSKVFQSFLPLFLQRWTMVSIHRGVNQGQLDFVVRTWHISPFNRGASSEQLARGGELFSHMKSVQQLQNQVLTWCGSSQPGIVRVRHEKESWGLCLRPAAKQENQHVRWLDGTVRDNIIHELDAAISELER